MVHSKLIVEGHLPERQLANDPVLVGAWMPDDDAPIHPGGMKPKRIFICPDDVRQPYLIRGHRYLFKQAEGFRAQQLWSEVIAYEIARAAGTDVPPASSRSTRSAARPAY